MNAWVYFSLVVVGLPGFTVAVCIVARRDKPVKLLPALLIILGAGFLAGVCCSAAASDIHILYWWLLGLVAAAVGFPALFGLINFVVGSFQRKK